MKSAALYVRVSTQEQAQHGISVESQVSALKQYCADHGYFVYNIYNDQGISARKTYKKRPALMQMIRDCQDHKVDIILMTKLDRFFRSVPDYYAVMEQIGGVPWRTIWEDYETETANGVFKVNIMLAVSQSEADRTSERIKSVMKYKRMKGEVVSGNVPVGYRIENKKPVIDPDTHDAMKAFWRSYLDGRGMNASRDAAKAYGLNIAVSSGSYILRHAESYTGCVQGIQCEPYITKEEALQVMSTRKSQYRRTTHPYMFRGILICGECGRNMGAHRNKLKSGQMQVYYNCTAHYADRGCENKVNIYERDIEKHLIESYDEELHSYVINVTVRAKDDSTERYKAELKVAEQKRNRLIDLYVDGMIGRDDYDKRKNEIDEEIEKLTKKIEVVPVGRTPQKLPSDWKDIYAMLDAEHRRAFWMRTLDRIAVDPDRNIRIIF